MKHHETPPRLSGKEALILQLLVNGKPEMYGLEMVRDADGELKRGTVYVLLSRMEEKGYITSRVELTPDKAHPGLARRQYRVSALGQRAYQLHERIQSSWGSAPVTA